MYKRGFLLSIAILDAKVVVCMTRFYVLAQLCGMVPSCVRSPFSLLREGGRIYGSCRF